MKNFLRASVILIFLVLLTSGAIALTQQNIYQSFESSYDGNIWDMTSGSFNIQNVIYKTGNGALRSNGTNTYLFYSFNSIGNIDVNSWVLFNSANTTPKLSLLNDSNSEICSLLVRGDASNAFQYIGDGGYTAVGGNASNNTWYKFQISVPLDTNKCIFRIYDSSNNLIQNATSSNTYTYSNFTKAGVGHYWTGSVESFFDDLNIIYFTQDVPPSIDANFNYTIHRQNSTIDFNNNSTDFNLTQNDWNWFINGILESTDQNFVFDTNSHTDINACLYVSGLGGDSATYSDYICKQFNTGQFEGRITINVYDENSLAELDNVNINFNGVDYNASNTMDINTTLTNTTSSQYTFTFTKTGYGTRYYTIDLNRFSDVNINIALLPSELGLNVEFQVYKTDKTTLYANTYIEMLLNDQQYKVAGRRKTSALGKVTFFINPNDSAYTMRIYGTDGTVDYNSMTLTVNKPKDESTGLTIDGNWELDVTGLAWQTYTNITGSQAIQIYANTFDEYGLEVSDSLANYFPRKYYVSYIGGTTAETLQPYLVDVNDAVNTTIFTISGYTQQPVPSVTIKIYKTVPVDGRVLVEQVTTDEKGEALISMIANQDYEFEIYLAGELLGSQTYRVTSTSTTIYISINDLTITTPILGQAYVNVKFTPNRSKLLGSDTTLTQTISLTDYNYGLTFTSAFIYVTNTDVNGVSGNDVNIYSLITTSQTNSITISSTNQTLDGNSYDTNGYLVVHVIVTTNLGTYTTKYVYSPQAGFDFYKAIGFDLRTNFGCSSTNDPLIPCGGMLFIALLVSILITIAFAMETGFTSQEGMAGLFLVIMGVFTYLAWVPVGIMALMAVSVIMLMIAIGGRNRI